ncbi:hypothetical protein L1887_53961 [Cichorium endivia]|nr:hypothetical protein L1887_53961 [Cichorium endivia]
MSASSSAPAAAPHAVSERRLLWKIDLLLMPLMTIAYGLQFYDKAILASASIFGILKDLELSVVHPGTPPQDVAPALLHRHLGVLLGLPRGGASHGAPRPALPSQRLPRLRYSAVGLHRHPYPRHHQLARPHRTALLPRRHRELRQSRLYPHHSLVVQAIRAAAQARNLVLGYGPLLHLLRSGQLRPGQGRDTSGGQAACVEVHVPLCRLAHHPVRSAHAVAPAVVATRRCAAQHPRGTTAFRPNKRASQWAGCAPTSPARPSSTTMPRCAPAMPRRTNTMKKDDSAPDTPAEQVVLNDRLAALNVSASTSGVRQRWNGAQIKEALMDYKIYIFFLQAIAIYICNGGVTAFGAYIIKSFGYTSLRSIILQTPRRRHDGGIDLCVDAGGAQGAQLALGVAHAHVSAGDCGRGHDLEGRLVESCHPACGLLSAAHLWRTLRPHAVAQYGECGWCDQAVGHFGVCVCRLQCGQHRGAVSDHCIGGTEALPHHVCRHHHVHGHYHRPHRAARCWAVVAEQGEETGEGEGGQVETRGGRDQEARHPRRLDRLAEPVLRVRLLDAHSFTVFLKRIVEISSTACGCGVRCEARHCVQAEVFAGLGANLVQVLMQGPMGLRMHTASALASTIHSSSPSVLMVTLAIAWRDGYARCACRAE